MNAQAMRAENVEVAPVSDRRREPRHATGIQGNLRASDGSGMAVRVAEISLHGCRITSERCPLRSGMFVSVGLDDQPPLEAIVRWVRGEDAGMEFLWPIPPERVEWLRLANLDY